MTVAKQNSETVSHRHRTGRNDARILRTRSRIDAAFVQLLHRRAYGDIRVSDITRKAAVGRATFYAHYAEKDDLLRSQFERVVAPMLINSAHAPDVVDARALFAHIRTAPHFYKALMGPNGGTGPRVLRDCFEKRARELLAIGDASSVGIKQAVIGRVVASSLLSITECWLERGSHETPEQLQTLFATLVTPGVRACRTVPQ